MDGDLLERLLETVAKWKRKPIQKNFGWESFADFLEDVKNPKPEEVAVVPEPLLKGFVSRSEFPKLKVRYDYAKGGEAQEWIVVNNGVEEAGYHANGWYTNWPPSVPASTKQTQTLESMIEQLKADGVKERSKEDWQRRKAASR